MKKLEQAARQALSTDEALMTLELILRDGIEHGNWPLNKNCEDGLEAITALRDALEQLNCQCGDKCFPVFSGDIAYCETCGKPTALAEQAEQEPVAKLIEMSKENFERHWGKNDFADWIYSDIADLFSEYAAPVQQAEQEPVGYTAQSVIDWLSSDERTDFAYSNINLHKKPSGNNRAPLYAAPVRTKYLTDDELKALWENTKGGWLGLFRAVIAKDREKNK